MPNPATKSHTINFAVAVSESQLAPPEREALEGSLKQSIRTLLADLSIPAKFTLTLESREAAGQPKSAVIVSIHGQKCRVPYASQRGREMYERPLAATIMEVIHRNRALLINRALVRRIAEAAPPESCVGVKQLASAELHRLLTVLAQRGFSMRRWMDFIPQADTAGWTYLQYYNAILAAVDATTIRIICNPAYQQLNEQLSAHTREAMASLIREGLFYELGVAFPQIQWAVDESLADNEFYVQLNDANYPPTFGLRPGEILVNSTAKRLQELAIEGKPVFVLVNGLECAVTRETYAEACKNAGLTTYNPLEYVILYLRQQLQQQAGNFLTRDMVAHDLDAMRLAFPALVDTALDRYELCALTWILRELLDEALPIRDLRSILDHLLLVSGTLGVNLSQHIVLYPVGTHLIPSNRAQLDELSFADYADYVRATALKRYISRKYSRGHHALLVLRLDARLEARLRQAQRRQLTERERNSIIEAICSKVGDWPPADLTPVILTPYEIRQQLQELVEVEFPHLAVLSDQEISPDINIQPIAEIGI